MKNMENLWIQKRVYEKVLYVISIICSISVIILAAIQLLGIWKTTVNVCFPLSGVVLLIQAIQNWKRTKGLAIFSLCVAIFIFLVAIFTFIS